MPIYEYKCDKCGDVYEVIQGFSDTPQTTHEGCGGNVHRLISPPAIQFKGSGWYVTDYARGGASKSDNGGKAETGKSDSGTKSEPAKTDSKPAASSGSKDKT
jgi:putative FmdB family regulatory protein